MTCGKDMSCGPVSSFTLAEVFRVMKTIRCGCLTASELKPTSKVFFSLMIVSHGQPAVLLNSPEMQCDKPYRSQRQNNAVKNIEAQQRVLPNDVATQRQKTNGAPQHGDVADDVGPHCDRPVSQLIPGK